MNKKQIALLATYVIGAFLTNSYCRNCRWNDWDQTNDLEWIAKHPNMIADPDPVFATIGATILWPVYVAARACDVVVNYATKIEVEWK